MPNGTPTREEIRADATKAQGLSTQQLLGLGLNPTEVQTIGSGFTGAFGTAGGGEGGEARAFRESRGLVTDEFGNVVPLDIPITAVQGQNVLNPQLPQGTQLNPVQQQIQPGEIQTTPQLGAAPQIAQQAPIGAVPQIQQQDAQVTTTDSAAALQGVQAEQVNAVVTSDFAPVQAQAATGTLTELATVRGQLDSLFADIETGEVPGWAIGAYNQAQSELASRGLGASTIGGGAITLAYMQSALPIASQDASHFYGMEMQNLANEQQASLENTRIRQQNVLTDVAVQNAALQFNASSKMQVQQFTSGLITQIQESNANRTTSISQFNAQQANQIDAQNSGNQLAVEQFNRELALNVDQFNANASLQRDQFNANMQFAVDQSNILWRRGVNTANTAAVNASNQINAQNMFNLSQVSMNNLWQEYRDNAAWTFEAAQNQIDRDYNLAMAAGNREFASRNDDADFWASMGTLAVDFIASL